MRVLLTGATGYLGQPLLQALVAAGHEVVVLGRKAPPITQGVHWLQADLLEPQDLKSLLSPLHATHLLHLAWYVEHGLFWSSPLNFRWVDASLRLLEAFCETGGQRAVMAGSCAEYDWAHGYCREALTPCHPETVYGAAKHATRLMASAFCASQGVSLAWGRLFLTYGRGEHAARLVPSLLAVFKGQRAPFGIHADAYRDFLHVDDAARGFLCLLSSNLEGPHNISSGQPVALKEVAECLAALCGRRADEVLALSSPRPQEPQLLVGEPEGLSRLGWRPQWSLPTGLAHYFQSEPG